jgi:Zn-dependent protease with chaperone function
MRSFKTVCSQALTVLALIVCVVSGWLIPPPQALAEGEDDPLWSQPTYNRKIFDIGQRLLAANRITERISFRYNADTKDMNAYSSSFYTPNTVMVYRGLLLCLTSDDELAAVLGHEIAHITLDHTRKALVHTNGHRVAGGALATAAILGSVVVPVAPLLLIPAKKMLHTHNTPGFSRQQELEADRVGMDIMVRAGYNPLAMETVLVKLGGDSDRVLTQWWVDHPLGTERLNAVRAHLEKHYPQFLTPELAKNLPGSPYVFPVKADEKATNAPAPASTDESATITPKEASAVKSADAVAAIPGTLVEKNAASPPKSSPGGLPKEPSSVQPAALIPPKKLPPAQKKLPSRSLPQRLNQSASTVGGAPSEQPAAPPTGQTSQKQAATVGEAILGLSPTAQRLLTRLLPTGFVSAEDLSQESDYSPEARWVAVNELITARLVRILGSDDERIYVLTDWAAESLMSRAKR